LPAGAGDALIATLRGFRRQALHAIKLEFVHPKSGEVLKLEVSPPADFEGLLTAMREDGR
jgi:23S rRNA pseudouridine1911/1915/1917 synthase